MLLPSARNITNYLGNGAQWIFVSNASEVWPDGYNATFQQQFYSNCPAGGSAYLYFAVANALGVIYINGVSVTSLNNWPGYSSQAINLQCGINNLTIQVINRSTNNTNGPLALMFYVSQTTYNCYKCGYGAIYNFSICSCQCFRGSSCAANQQWVDYPTCGCTCINQANTACTTAQYFNTVTCSCTCIPYLCPPFLDLDPTSCTCRCKAQSCPTGLVWNYNRCRCEANSQLF